MLAVVVIIKIDDGKTTRSTLANDSTATSSTTTTIRNKAF